MKCSGSSWGERGSGARVVADSIAGACGRLFALVAQESSCGLIPVR
jgi:hypothetical protein